MFEENNPEDGASDRPISSSATHLNRAPFILPWVYEAMGARTDRGPRDSLHGHDSTSTGRLVRANSIQRPDLRAIVDESITSTAEETDEEASSSHTPVPVRTSFKMRSVLEAIWKDAESFDDLRRLTHHDNSNNIDYAPESNNLRREQQRHEHHAHTMEVRPRRPFHIYGTNGLHKYNRR